MGPIVVLGVGGYLVIHDATQVGTLVVFVPGLSKVADPWDQLVNFYRSVSNTAIAYDMIRDQIKTNSRARVVCSEDAYASIDSIQSCPA